MHESEYLKPVNKSISQSHETTNVWDNIQINTTKVSLEGDEKHLNHIIIPNMIII